MVGVSITKQFTVSKATTTTQTIYTVTPGQKLKLKTVKVWFPSGTNSELQVVILRGVEKIVPSDGHLVGDGQEFVYDVDLEYGSQEDVKAQLVNTSSASDHMVQITLEGEEY